MQELTRHILDAYPYVVVYCDREHIVRYMNKTAQEHYTGRVAIGDSIFGCHKPSSNQKIIAFLARADAGEGIMYETWSPERKKREFFVPVRDDTGYVIGYYEMHERLWTEDAPDTLLFE